MTEDEPGGSYPISRKRIEELEARRYFYETGVLVNKPGITDPGLYQEYEYGEVRRRMSTRPHMEAFNYAELQGIHLHLFQNVWEWAGETRSYTTGRNDPSFSRPEFIEPELNKLFSELNSEKNLVGMERPKFVERATHYTNEINAIHPFVEGNGRVTRAFLEDLAAKQNLLLDIAKIEPDQWNQASRYGFYNQPERLRDCIESALSERPLQVEKDRHREPETASGHDPSVMPDQEPSFAPEHEEIQEPGIAVDQDFDKDMER